MIFTVSLGDCEAEAKRSGAFRRSPNNEVFCASPFGRVLCSELVNKIPGAVFSLLLVTSHGLPLSAPHLLLY